MPMFYGKVKSAVVAVLFGDHTWTEVEMKIPSDFFDDLGLTSKGQRFIDREAWDDADNPATAVTLLSYEDE